MRRSRVPDLEKRCPACLFRPEDCLCAEIPALRPRVPFLVLRHASERNRTTNSGRWAAAALGAPLVDYGLEGAPFDDALLREAGTWVLWPSAAPTPPDAAPPRRLVLVDASWSQARRMMQRIPALQAMPRLSLPAPPPRERLRVPPGGGMSTLEAAAQALHWLGDPEGARRLDGVMAAAVERQRRLRGQPLGGFA